MVDSRTDCTCSRSWSGTLDIVVTGRSACDQVWTVKRIVPCLNHSRKLKTALHDPMVDVGRLVSNRARVEHADVDR